MGYIKSVHSFIQKAEINIVRAENRIHFSITGGGREVCFQSESDLPYRN